MKGQWRRVVFFHFPLACNAALIAYLAWQLGYTAPLDRHSRLQMFALLYAVGGIVLAVSGVAAFMQAAARENGWRGYYSLALVNVIIPTLLLLIMLKLA